MSIETSQFAWTPAESQIQSSRLNHFLTKLGIADLTQLEEKLASGGDAALEWFWREALTDLDIEWKKAPRQMLDTSEGLPWTHWWPEGRLNLVDNALTKHAQRTPSKAALVWEGEDGTSKTYTYAELDREVAKAVNALRALGINPGDAVGLCLPMIPECVILFLACAKAGAIIAPLFSGYGASAIASRLNDCSAKLLCVADGFPRRGATVAMKSIADEAAAEIPSLEHMLVVQRMGTTGCQMTAPRDVWYHEIVSGQQESADTCDTDADETFMLIYTSGTTGKPKGTVHVHGGFPIKAAQDMAHCFDVKSDDRLLWFTDIGWMMGPWAICGALILGATLVIFEGVPDYPDPGRLWDVVQKHRISVLGVAPTVIRALMRHGDEPVHQHDLSSLRVLGSSGEPWNDDPWLWFLRVVGRNRCPIINYSGGTEVSGGILAGNMLTPLKPCAFGGPVPGMVADVLDENGKPVRGSVGELAVRRPWPGMTRGFWHDKARYLQTYWSRFPEIWVHGDWAEIDEDGLWYIRGRSDDTIKIAGKRLGPAEVESVVVSHRAVAEAAAIGVPDELKGESLTVFAVLRPGATPSDTVKKEISDLVGSELGKALKPGKVEFVKELPKTRNAKVLRRVLRAVYLGLEPGDLSSLENTSALDAIRAVTGKN